MIKLSRLKLPPLQGDVFLDGKTKEYIRFSYIFFPSSSYPCSRSVDMREPGTSRIIDV